MKILYHHRTGSKDGQAVHIEELVGAFRALGHEVIVAEPPATGNADFGKKPGLFAWVRRHLPKAIYELLELAYNIPAYLRLRRAYLTHKPDVLYERHNLYLLAGAWLKRSFDVPYMLEVNAPMFVERKRHGGLALERIAQGAENWVWRQADYAFPVTNVLGRMIEAAGVPPQRIVVVPNGIAPERFNDYPPLAEAKRRLGLEQWLVLGFTGFVREWNALDQVIALIARPGNERLFLLVVGDGPARPGLEALATALGVADRLRFTGVVGRSEVRDYVAAFDIALQPAANPYASPLKLFEYLALGRTIVAPAQDNLLEVLTHGVDAYLYPPGHAGGLGAAIALLAADPELRGRLAAQARQTVFRRRLTWMNNATRVIELARTGPRDADPTGAQPAS